MQNNITPPNINIQELVKAGEEIYQKELRGTLEPADNGKYVAIEVGSREYFVGVTKEEAVSLAKNKFPDKVLYIRRVGEAERIASYSHFSPLNCYDWLL